MTAEAHVLLQGVVGSTAYGLAGADSDIDRLGIFAVPTVDLHGLSDPAESIVTTKPDITLHEARKYCRLALAGNPTVMELMWLPYYEIATDAGRELVLIRSAFLSAPRVRAAYLGYATQQFRKLHVAWDRQAPPARMEKHARHLYRLCYQGWHLYQSGQLMIELDEPGKFLAFGTALAETGDFDAARNLLARYEDLFNRTTSPLPAEPDKAAAEAWLRAVRREMLNAADADLRGYL